MRSLTPDEAEWIKERIGPLMPLIARVRQFLERRGYDQTHPLYNAISEAYDALRGLWITAHYEGCGRGIGRSSEVLPDSPPRSDPDFARLVTRSKLNPVLRLGVAYPIRADRRSRGGGGPP